MVAISACGLDDKGSLDTGAGAGGHGANGSGGTSVGGGACFPGTKLCKDSATGQTVCLDADKPENGCALATACDPCSTPNATAICVERACAIASCNSGYKDCDGAVDTGCESNSQTDPKNCGDCAIDCTVNGDQICVQGVCVVNNCPGTLRDCDLNPGNGCEVDTASDTDNCGFCGNVCTFAHAVAACTAGACTMGACDPGYSDCNPNVVGCETHTDEDPDHCGSCTNACQVTGGTPQCDSGTCKAACPTGWADCDSTLGCEAQTNTPTHCGSCAGCNEQNVGAAKCLSGVCDYDKCDPGFADCDGDRTNGCEVNTKSDNKNCGGCNKPCPSDQQCDGSGKCACTDSSLYLCPDGQCHVCCKDGDCGGSPMKCCNLSSCKQGNC